METKSQKNVKTISGILLIMSFTFMGFIVICCASPELVEKRKSYKDEAKGECPKPKSDQNGNFYSIGNVNVGTFNGGNFTASYPLYYFDLLNTFRAQKNGNYTIGIEEGFVMFNKIIAI